MITKFNIGDMVFFSLPYHGEGFIEKITITSKDTIVYDILIPSGEIVRRLESSLYGKGKSKERV